MGRGPAPRPTPGPTSTSPTSRSCPVREERTRRDDRADRAITPLPTAPATRPGSGVTSGLRPRLRLRERPAAPRPSRTRARRGGPVRARRRAARLCRQPHRRRTPPARPRPADRVRRAARPTRARHRPGGTADLRRQDPRHGRTRRTPAHPLPRTARGRRGGHHVRRPHVRPRPPPRHRAARPGGHQRDHGPPVGLRQPVQRARQADARHHHRGDDRSGQGGVRGVGRPPPRRQAAHTARPGPRPASPS